MQHNINNCKVVSVGRCNPRNSYTINNKTLVSSEHEKDLRVRITSDISLRKQCIETRNLANMVQGYIFRIIKSSNTEVILKLYLAPIRPHLDYAVYSSGPHIRGRV